MKYLGIVLLAFAVGLSACAKKKKKTEGNNAAGGGNQEKPGDTVKVTSAYGIKLSEDGKTFVVEKAGDDNDKNQKNGNCSLEELNKTILAEINKPFSVELKDGVITVANEAGTAVLQGKAADDAKDKVEGKYDDGKGLMFGLTKDSLGLEKTCKK